MKIEIIYQKTFINHFISTKGDSDSESTGEALQSYNDHFFAGNSMEREFENQKCIKVSLAHVYNGSLVLNTEEKSLSKTATFLTSAI